MVNSIFQRRGASEFPKAVDLQQLILRPDLPRRHGEARLQELLAKHAQLNAALDLDKHEAQVVADPREPEAKTVAAGFAARIRCGGSNGSNGSVKRLSCCISEITDSEGFNSGAAPKIPQPAPTGYNGNWSQHPSQAGCWNGSVDLIA